MLNSKDFSEKHYHIWNTLNQLFNSKESGFPCLYAISSFNKGEMYFGVSNKTASCANTIANDLKEMTHLLDGDLTNESKSLITYVNIISKDDISDVESFLVGLLRDIHKLDNKEWPDSVTKNMSDHDFEFYYNGCAWFPVLLSPSHPSTIRRSPYILIAFQPGVTFDYNKNIRTEFYQRMRASIHNRIDSFYKNERPYYLSDKSSGKNFFQYVGFDYSGNTNNDLFINNTNLLTIQNEDE